jgi:hypothetical protein
LIKS